MDLSTCSYSGKVNYRARHYPYLVYLCVCMHIRCREMVRPFWLDEPACSCCSSSSGSKYVQTYQQTDNHPTCYNQPFQPANGPPSTSNIQPRHEHLFRLHADPTSLLASRGGGDQLSDRIKLETEAHSCLIPRLSFFPAHSG